MKKGALYVVSSGIKGIAHVTSEAKQIIRIADKVLYVLADDLSKIWIKKMNKSAEPMHKFYENGKPRDVSYREMNEYTMSFLRQDLTVCVVYYGHAGVFCTPSHLSIKQARNEGYSAQMLPGISAEDCLFSDLNIDPAMGCQSYEATDFLIYNRIFDTKSYLILWQIGVIGCLDFQLGGYSYKKGISILTDYLLKHYPKEHKVSVYEASTVVTCEPIISTMTLEDLKTSDVISAVSTLLVFPYFDKSFMGADQTMLKELGIKPEQINFVRFKELAGFRPTQN